MLALALSAATKADVYVPDIVGGADDFPAEGGDWGTLPAWFSRHGDDATMPRLRAAIAGARQVGVQKVVAFGFCWGARYAVLAAAPAVAAADAWAVAQ